MSNNAVSAQATFGAIISDALANFAGSTPTRRAIANIYPHVTTQEIHHDELQITQHPVETGTPVTDHAFPQPFTVEMHVNWSDSTAQTSGYVQAVYRALLNVQRSRQPISATTGKRIYNSMLIKSILVDTDLESENSLSVVVLLQQIVITSTQSVTASSARAPSSAGLPSSGLTDGSATVGSTAPATALPAAPGAAPPVSTFDNGVGTIPPGSITGGPDFSWPNDVVGSGATNLLSGGPTVESLTAQGGV